MSTPAPWLRARMAPADAALVYQLEKQKSKQRNAAKNAALKAQLEAALQRMAERDAAIVVGRGRPRKSEAERAATPKKPGPRKLPPCPTCGGRVSGQPETYGECRRCHPPKCRRCGRAVKHGTTCSTCYSRDRRERQRTAAA